MRVVYGPALRNILSIEKSPNTSGILQVPVVVLSSGLSSIITIKAESARLYQLSFIDRINIISNSFPVLKDLQLSDKPSLALASFTINPDDIQDATFATYSFDGSIKNARRYRMTSDQPINYINITFQMQFVDGTTEDILLLPFETMNMLITFNKIA